MRELSGVFEFERLAIVLVEADEAVVMANSGRQADELYPRGTARPVAGSVLEDVIRESQTIMRGDMDTDPRYPEEKELAQAGLRSRVVVPLAPGGQFVGMLSVFARSPTPSPRTRPTSSRCSPARSATRSRTCARTYSAERNAAEELRRLSALRADFVSLVSHELRAPMASVIGCAATLRQRWRELAPDQRESFLALIEQETNRLSTLVGDVLDTSRIEAGTFTYVMGDVDLGEL
ncbi:MAG TPA: histidine kinase dimerization/phospho-acceptor domain-containing protein, partial [Gaiellaceae bacterium]|nr:histidine kinase dimerization/phospho-acceptor domain-containing protein [Gaiellaceae bacterium]